MAKARFLSSGDTALVVEFGDQVARSTSDEVLALAARIGRAGLAGIVELVPTFRSLMVHYDPLRNSAAGLTTAIEALLVGDAELAGERRLWRVPVCYEGDLAPDLAEVAERTRMTPGEVVALHAEQTYHVYMIGFLPGFPYMGDLPQPLVLPRRVDPRVRVPPGSVAIATTLTAIYPLESPGGWHLVGTTPVKLFDEAWPSPALFAPGDAVRFEPVGRRAFDDLAASVARGGGHLEPEALAS